jgi:Fur family ferric uptake transcriptional regulator
VTRARPARAAGGRGGVALQDLDLVCGRLHDAGLRLTGPRRRLVAVFAGLGHWCTPAELYAAARAAGVPAGRATVYRLLEVLVEQGLCRVFAQRDRSVRYVFCGPGHHHHMICEDCGRVTEIAECAVEPPPAGFAVREHAVDFFGQCDRCQAAKT